MRIDNNNNINNNTVCIALFSGVHKLSALCNIFQHFLSEKEIDSNMFTSESNTYMATNNIYTQKV